MENFKISVYIETLHLVNIFSESVIDNSSGEPNISPEICIPTYLGGPNCLNPWKINSVVMFNYIKFMKAMWKMSEFTFEGIWINYWI